MVDGPRSGMDKLRFVTAALSALAAGAGCLFDSSGLSGGSGGSGGGSATTSSSAGASTSTSSTGASTPCSLGDTQSCYGGPASTENVGACKSGTQTCDSNGAWGACDGEVLPVPGPEDCAKGLDL